MKSRRNYLEQSILELLRSKGFHMQKGKRIDNRSRTDMVFRSNSSELIVECKALNLYRAPDFRSVIGDTILRFQHMNRGAHRRLLMAILLQRMSSKSDADLRDYAHNYLPDLQWIVLDENGSGVIRLDEQDERVSVPAFEGTVHRDFGADRGSLFSPNNQWLFKVLLLPGVSSKYWGGPAQRPNSVSELAKLSGVSQPSVSAFVSKAEQNGFLKRGSRGFVLQHHQELLDDWAYALKNRSRRAIGLKPLYPNEPEEKFLRKFRSYCHSRKDGPVPARVAVGGNLGCHLLGLGRSNVRQARLYAEGNAKDILSALDLVDEPGKSAQFSLIVQPSNCAVFRGAVDVDGASVCDALQCYFDVRFSYARGKEQADYIYERVLQPHFEERK